ncbi:UNVERIFIED_CONTAM: hypothetical protein Sangu_3061500 [Sesamum angustifolium]|uniref:Uncharacterized protein n=2 Tax=Sesamum TaxID=4181 RepID=A0AAE1WX67_9LAMI|nr:hypothetical protein Sango_1202400 [Sesamum angolense]
MGNCSLRAVTDADGEAEQRGGEEAVRVSAFNRLRSVSYGKTSVEVLPPPGAGVWKVKLVIDPKDLERILAEQVNTEALIEHMRIAANSTPKRGKSSWGGADGRHCSVMCSFK